MGEGKFLPDGVDAAFRIRLKNMFWSLLDNAWERGTMNLAELGKLIEELKEYEKWVKMWKTQEETTLPGTR